MVDRAQLADFLRRRRELLQPDDVGFGTGPRRRTKGLRREEVAMLAALARALRLSQDERDHLFRLAGHAPGPRARRTDHVNPALMRVLDRIDAPAQVMSDLGETLVQNRLAVALVGDQTRFTGPARSLLYRWFTDPAERERYPPEEHLQHSRVYVAYARGVLARDPTDVRAAEIVEQLKVSSPEFTDLWAEHEVAVDFSERKRIVHPQVGTLDLHCQELIAADEGQVLLVYTATPGTEDYEKLQLLSVVGTQQFS